MLDLLVQCERCGQFYARVFIDAARGANCRCGSVLAPRGPEPVFVDHDALVAEERRLQELARAAERLCFLIVATDCPRIDIEIERGNLRRRCASLFPDKMELYDMVYEGRFRRLWEQFRRD
jgi:hypothetical protein